jgi:CheY-like chemotaxis protein
MAALSSPAASGMSFANPRPDDGLLVEAATLAAAGERDSRGGQSGMTTMQSKPYSILITDDDRACRESLKTIVEEEGFQTRLASSGEEAIDIVRGQPVHLALLDMQMPTLTGLETIELVRQVNAMLPCILVTAEVNDMVMRQALSAHVYSVIAKPVSKHVVLYTVVRALFQAYGSPSEQWGQG